MEVIRHGNTYKEVKCKKCNALLSYGKSDIKYDDRDERYFGVWHYSRKEYVVCPECQNEIILYWTIDGEEVKNE